jgi:integrase
VPTRPKEPHSQFYKRETARHGTRWQAIVIYYDPRTGKRRQTAQTFARKHEAEAWARLTEARFRTDPAHTAPSTETFGAFLDRWLSTIDQSDLSPHTKADYRRHASTARAALGAKRLRDLTPLDFQGLYADLAARGLTRTVGYVHAVCRRALGAAVDWELIPRNPAAKARPPKRPTRPIQPLTPEQTRQFLRQADQHRWRALWYVLALTGLRRGEAVALKWEDIDWDRQQAVIHRAAIQVGSRIILRDQAKTAAGNRTVNLSPFLLDILRAHRDAQRQAGGPGADAPWVFATTAGRHLRPDNAYHAFKRLLRQAGLPPTTRIHDLRHGMATYWLAQGVPVKVVSERLGHASVAITLQIYGHVVPGMQAEAAARLDAALAGEGLDSSTLHQHEPSS